MMEQQIPKAQQFRAQLQESLRAEIMNFATIQVSKNQRVYLRGDPAERIYFIECGQIKLLKLSPEGKECVLTILTAGDLFGETCLADPHPRQESAMVMRDARLIRIPRAEFLRHLSRHALMDGFVQYLVARIAEQQQVIAHLITVDSEHRLGETLLLLAHKLGQPDPRSTRIEQRITHEELSEMVGTTRPRVTKFMLKFRGLGLIEVSPERGLIVKEQQLADYLAQLA